MYATCRGNALRLAECGSAHATPAAAACLFQSSRCLPDPDRPVSQTYTAMSLLQHTPSKRPGSSHLQQAAALLQPAAAAAGGCPRHTCRPCDICICANSDASFSTHWCGANTHTQAGTQRSPQRCMWCCANKMYKDRPRGMREGVWHMYMVKSSAKTVAAVSWHARHSQRTEPAAAATPLSTTTTQCMPHANRALSPPAVQAALARAPT